MQNCDIRLTPVGSVRVGAEGFVLSIDPAYRAALAGLEGFSHVNVLWWAHFLAAPEYRAMTQVEQPYRNAPSRLGTFATRSPMRPNPLGLSVVPLLHVDQEHGLLYVAYIDAENGTPILDIKPYQPAADRVRTLVTPDWCAHWPQWYEESVDFDWAGEFVNAR